MNELIIPPAANWYEPYILACAPDNTLIYGARNDLVVIQESPDNKAPQIRIISKAHSQKVLSVNLNKNWGQPNKLAVTVAEDKIIKLWNIDTLEKKISHNGHIMHDKVIGATFAGDERVISVAENGTIIVWNVTLNETNVIKDLFGFKVTVTVISTCPHASWLTAFGLKNGLVVVADLRKNGKILYKLRGHERSVLSLSWCPAPVNIFPKIPKNYVGAKSSEKDTKHQEISNIEDAKIKEHVALTTNKDNLCEEPSKENNSKKYPQGQDKEDIIKCEKPSLNPDNNLKEMDTSSDNQMKGLAVKEDLDQLKEINQMNELDIKEDLDQLGKVCKEVTFVENIKDTEKGVDSIIQKVTFIQNIEDTEKVVDSIIQEAVAKTEEKLKQQSSNKKANPWANLKFPDDEDQLLPKDDQDTSKMHPLLNIYESSDDFLSQCQELKTKILGVQSPERTEEKIEAPQEVEKEERSILKAKHNKKEKKSKEKYKASHNKQVQKPGGNSKVDKLNIDCQNISTECHKDSPTNREPVDMDMTRCTPTEISVTEPVSEQEEPRKEFLLASSARESCIYIWRAGTDGRMQTFLTLPHKNNSHRGGKASDKIWITLCWATPNMLLSSSKTGELLQWYLPKPNDVNKQYRLVHKDHSSLLFSIAVPVKFSNEYNWLDKNESNAWTLGQDRLLINTSLGNDRKNLDCYPTLGGSLNCIASSPLDPNRLAIGTGEGVIKVWDLSRPHTRNIVMSSFHQKVQSRVTSVAWHPTVELLLGFGTLEGRVGLIDTFNKSKSPTVLKHYFKSQIYKIEWGPMNGNKNSLGLYALSEGKLVVFDAKKTDNEPTEVDTPDNTFVYMMSWKPDYSKLLLSTKNGTLLVYSTDLNMIAKYYFQEKLQAIVWHPDSVSEDASKYCNWFAAIIKFKECVVFDLSLESDKIEDKTVVKFKCRDELLNSLAWSLHEGNKIVSTSDDGVAQVYNVETKTLLSTYLNPNFDGISAVVWSPIDPDYIITGTKDNKLIVWKISENAPKTDEEIAKIKKKITKAISKETTDLLPTVEQLPEEEKPKPKKAAKHSILPIFYVPRDRQVAQDIKKLLLWKEGNVNVESQIGDHAVTDILQIFGENTEMKKLVDVNEMALKERGKYNLSSTLSLWKGDTSTAVKEAIEEKRVNPLIISLAPMVSPKLWQTACEVYANQLCGESDADPLEIVTYFLACHKVEEAINVLIDNFMFREGLALAKSRLSDEDPIIKTIIEKWAKHSNLVGYFELAAQCYIFLGKYEEAATVLFRRTDVEILKVAVDIAEKSGNEELHKAVKMRYDAFKAEKDSKGSKKDGLKVKCDKEIKQTIEASEETNKNQGYKKVQLNDDLNITVVEAICVPKNNEEPIIRVNEDESNGKVGKQDKREDTTIEQTGEDLNKDNKPMNTTNENIAEEKHVNEDKWKENAANDVLREETETLLTEEVKKSNENYFVEENESKDTTNEDIAKKHVNEDTLKENTANGVLREEMESLLTEGVIKRNGNDFVDLNENV